MKVVCKVKGISTLTYLKVYDVVDDRGKSEDSGGYVIIDDFENRQYYFADYFMSLDEGRDCKIDLIFN